MYDARIGRWLSVDPLVSKFPSNSPYIFALNSPNLFIDKDGKEPARNQSGTIQQAIEQWRNMGLTTMENIRDFVTTKTDDVMAIRYVYSEDHGWIDLQHYFGVQTYGKVSMDALEEASGSRFMQNHIFGEGADASYYSYEDLPSNEFSDEVDLDGMEGEALFGAVEEHFEDANATTPENAPNWELIPLDDRDRQRLPYIKEYETFKTYKDGMLLKKPVYYSSQENKKFLETGIYIPQNHTSTPLNLNNFDAANTSLQKQSENE
jgi:hypothetical protein